jgi:lysophospholipase L1-like esterase
MLGSNASKTFNWQGKEHFLDTFNKLLDDYKDSKIILCTPATAFYIDENGEVSRDDDDGVTTFEIQPSVVEEIADIVRDVAVEDDYPLVEINDLTYDHPEWFSVDGTHPNEDGAKAIAEAVYKKLAESQ